MTTTQLGAQSKALETISRYYDGCSRGDIELMLSTLHENVVHYFLSPNLGSAPVGGAEHLARYWRKVTSMIDALWVVDAMVENGDAAVIEWTLFWTPQGATEQVATRGAEWFDFKDGKIIEIRSYYQQRSESTELDGFPYGERGYSTLERRVSTIHDPLAAGTANGPTA